MVSNTQMEMCHFIHNLDFLPFLAVSESLQAHQNPNGGYDTRINESTIMEDVEMVYSGSQSRPFPGTS